MNMLYVFHIADRDIYEKKHRGWYQKFAEILSVVITIYSVIFL